jgi:mannose-6-phosphate isomerase-like protein (cupin superfamily)
VLRLEDGERVMHPGDVVVQLGNWHGWTNPRQGSSMAFVMMGATFGDVDAAPDSPAGQPIEMPDGVRPIRRIVTIDDENGRSHAIQDGPCPDVRIDPARPGFSSTRIWVTDRTPARIDGVRETLHAPHSLEPPRGGSVCRIVALPPDATYRNRVGAREVQTYFDAMGSPGASTYSAKAPHPHMQKTQTLDLCLVLDGEVTLVLDTAHVPLKRGDTVIQRATNHAWSNASNRPAVVAISSHDARA